MGDIADMMLEGVLCEGCGVYLDGESPGYPRYCGSCKRTEPKKKKPRNEVICGICNKKVNGFQGIHDHMRTKHGKDQEHYTIIAQVLSGA